MKTDWRNQTETQELPFIGTTDTSTASSNNLYRIQDELTMKTVKDNEDREIKNCYWPQEIQKIQINEQLQLPEE